MLAHICLIMSNDLSASSSTIDDIVEDFALIDDWEERYRYVIELGRALSGLPDSAKTEDNRVRGCASQVWLETIPGRNTAGEPALTFNADSDAHIVRGLIAILLTIQSGKTAREILAADPISIFDEFGFREHLTPQRSNGLRAMAERIKNDARETLASAS